MSIPTYEAIKSGNACLFYCPKCGQMHLHSCPEIPDVPEHRVAHCQDRQSHPKGYYLFIRSALRQTPDQNVNGTRISEHPIGTSEQPENEIS